MTSKFLHDSGLQFGLSFAPVFANGLPLNIPRHGCALQLETLVSGDPDL